MIIEKTKNKAYTISLEEMLEPADVLLVVSPPTLTTMPLFGIHLLQVCCRNAGINTGIFYSNFLYSNQIGADIHKTIFNDYQVFLGERIFAFAAFGLSSVSIGLQKHKFSNPTWIPDHIWPVNEYTKVPQVPEAVVESREWLGNVDLEYLELLTTNWLHALARQIVNIGFRIVGCSTTLGGLVPAVALLNCIKKADPEVIAVLGGPLCKAEMAEGILSLNTGIDYIFSGEGEITFPILVKKILEGRLPGEKVIYGEDVIDLDTIPLPDYRDYMVQREKFHPHKSSSKNQYLLPFESSRGCWYGNCTFCGLNGKQNVFRMKSPDVVIQSLKALVERYPMCELVMNDNVMPIQYFDILIPRISTENFSNKIFYEIRADLTIDQVLSLKKAGIITLQPGIESLSSSLLKRMHKPYTVRENISFLRYARSADINVIWNILFGVPGDQIREYEEMLHLLPLIRHLQPPRRTLPLYFYRYSKYHTSPKSYGIYNLQPAKFYKDILPSHADLDKIANYFTADFPSQSRENPAVINALWKECQAWRNAWAAYRTVPIYTLLPILHVVHKTPGRYVLEDSRGLPGLPKRMEINRDQASLLLVARPLEAVSSDDVSKAVDAGLGVVKESWFIPLATADPALLQEFERDYEHSRLSSTRCYEKD